MSPHFLQGCAEVSKVLLAPGAGCKGHQLGCPARSSGIAVWKGLGCFGCAA